MLSKLDATSLGVVVSGGGMRSSYAAGALRALAEVHGIVTPKVLVGVSGGAGTGIFYLARRYDNMDQWADLFDDSRVISWKRLHNGPIWDINFMIDHIMKVQAPNLDEEIAAVSAKYFIAATKLPNACPHWFSSNSSESIFEQLRASKTMPGISAFSVKIHGEEYADGDLSVSIEDLVSKALAEGAEQVILIDNRTPTLGKQSLVTRSLLRFKNRHAEPHIKRAVAQYAQKESRPLSPSSWLKICRPQKLPTVHGLVRTARTTHASIRQGYEDMAKLSLT